MAKIHVFLVKCRYLRDERVNKKTGATFLKSICALDDGGKSLLVK